MTDTHSQDITPKMPKAKPLSAPLFTSLISIVRAKLVDFSGS